MLLTDKALTDAVKDTVAAVKTSLVTPLCHFFYFVSICKHVVFCFFWQVIKNRPVHGKGARDQPTSQLILGGNTSAVNNL